MRNFLTLIAISVLLTACHKDDETEEPVYQEPERSVLVYMAAENNLNGICIDDLNEMLTGSKSLSDLNQLLVYVDLPDKAPYFARIKNGLVVDSVGLSESSTADPAILEKMLNYMRTNYKAKSYGLVLWGHASGWLINKNEISYARSRAYGVDNNGNNWMNIPPMARAIANGMGSDRLKFIFADCCNFNCVESAYELRNVTDYLIGSPAEIPDYGAPYDIIVPDLFNTSDNFYQTIVDHYYDYYLSEYKLASNARFYYNLEYGDLAGFSLPLSAIKTSELENLAQATATLVKTIPDKVRTEGTIDMSNSVYYAIDGTSNSAFGYDMYMMLQQNTEAADFKTWTAALNKAVAYKRYSSRWLTAFTTLRYAVLGYPESAENVCCLSMFFPHKDYNYTSPNWNTSIKQFQWNNIIAWEQYGW